MLFVAAPLRATGRALTCVLSDAPLNGPSHRETPFGDAFDSTSHLARPLARWTSTGVDRKQHKLTVF